MPKRFKSTWSVGALVWLLCATTALAGPPRSVRATVQRVVDGDTLIAVSENATKLRIRLLGIDAPEISHGSKPGQSFAPESRRYLEQLINNRPVRLELSGPDVYGRILAVVLAGDMNVNVQMVRAGLAEVYRGARCRAYCRELAEAEAGAQQQRAGIWAQERHESPAAYRKRTKS
jgi:micrococcal nuclease